MSLPRPAKRLHAVIEAAPTFPASASLSMIAVGTDPATRAAVEATDVVLASLRETGVAVLTVSARDAKALRCVLMEAALHAPVSTARN